MEEKFKAYEKYDWSKSSGWINYYDNLYPAPPLKVLDKFKRKWYKKNIDSDFIVDYVVPEPTYGPAAGAAAGANPYAGQQSPNNPYAQYYRADVHPALLTWESIAWILFFLALPLGLYATLLAFIAVALGCYKRNGKIQFNQAYLQLVLPDENTHNLMYVGVVAMIGGN